MRFDGWFDDMRVQMAQRYGEPIEALLLVHKSGEKPQGKAGRLHPNNVLTLSATHLRINALGGRNGLKPGKDIAIWRRDQVVLDVFDTEKASWFNTTMSWMEWSVHRLRITGPDLTMVVDVMRENPLADPVPELEVLWAAIGPRVAS